MNCWRILIGALCLLATIAPLQGGTIAQFRTTFGDMEVELYDQDKPATVQNFIRYVLSGRYQDSFSHRLVTNFVVQGGGFYVTNRGSLDANIVPLVTFPPITNEFGVGRKFSNTFGTIAMAKKGGNTNSATSQWFINLADNTSLDAADTNNFFVVFGKVVKGTNVLNVLNSFQDYTGVQTNNLVANCDPAFNWAYWPAFATTPLLRPILDQSTLLYFDISLLVRVDIEQSSGNGKQISWNSIPGGTNLVEFTTSFPASWQTLVRTNGNGTRMSVVDPTADPRRFYRVRVQP
jgi:cyclophilin family peptidyl-prolyl cis-trans isomerase